MRIARIVVGVDLTAASVRAAEWVAGEFAPDAEVMLLHCVKPLASEHRIAELRERADRALTELARRIGEERCRWETRVGDAARAIAELAAEFDAQLVAVGAHEEHDDRPPAVGSTAERLVRCSPVPVLLCARSPEGVPRSVLLPVEGAGVDRTLAEWTEMLTHRFRARLALVHVDPAPGAAPALARSRTPTTPWGRLAHELPVERVFVDAAPGDPADVVVAESRRFHSDLVLLHAPADGAPDPIAPGERADPVDRVLRRATCPVLVVPPADVAGSPEVTP